MKAAAAAALIFIGAGNLALADDIHPSFPAGVSWDWQLTEPLDLSRDVALFDLHPGLLKAEDIAGLKARGIRTICYVSIGTLEKTSPDRDRFPAEVVGKVYGDWPDEKFLNVRRLDILAPLMRERFEHCKALGFDAIEPDNMDVHVNDTGFDISESDALAYVLELAGVAHGLGLAIGQKNVPEMTPKLVGTLDFVIAESCYQDGWCDDLQPYRLSGKGVYDAEYTDRPLDFDAACAYAAANGVSMIVKDRDLSKGRRACGR